MWAMAVSLQNSPGPDDDDTGYRQMSEINITPFVDVMLVLLVIFMVAAPLMIAGVPVDLPQISATRISQPRKPVLVTLTSDQKPYIREVQVAADQLVARLAALRAQEGDNVVYLSGDKTRPYGDVIAVLGRVGESGYHRISLLSQAQPAAGAK
jgi:biopolymer transport protein TolR